MRKIRWKGNVFILLLMILFTFGACSIVYAGVEDRTPTVPPTDTPTVTPVVTPSITPVVLKNGLKKENNKYYFYVKGKKTKNQWKTIDKHTYYFKADGSAATYSYAVKKVYYVFKPNGQRLAPAKTKLMKIGNRKYYVTPKGKAVPGWIVLNHKLYYIYYNGKAACHRTCRGITFTKSSWAENNIATKLKIRTMEIVASITNSKMSQSQKLYASWCYICSGRFHYVSKYPNLNASGWQKSTALDMLTSYSGNCYSFACGFAALAKEVGYEPTMVCGRISGSRDGAGDGLTRHCWVLINGLHYDPEGQYAGWGGGIYGRGYYPFRHSIQRYVKFW